MPIVRPQDVVAEIDQFYPPGLDGKGPLPLSADVVAQLQSILNLIARIPAALLPRKPDSLVNRSIDDVRQTLEQQRRRDAVAGPGRGQFSLRSLSEFGGRNALAVLREELSKCANYTPKELRRKLLEQIAAYHEAGTLNYPDTAAIGPLGLTLDKIRRQMQILKDEGLVELTGSFERSSYATITPAGWRELEDPLEEDEQSDSPIVFISCGQSNESEKHLGQTLAALVTELTPYEGYFAQNQTSLAALSEHIFGALNSAVGLVAVMHHRGIVKTPHGEHTRGSIWVEQEIAIAAFLSQAQGVGQRLRGCIARPRRNL